MSFGIGNGRPPALLAPLGSQISRAFKDIRRGIQKAGNAWQTASNKRVQRKTEVITNAVKSTIMNGRNAALIGLGALGLATGTYIGWNFIKKRIKAWDVIQKCISKSSSGKTPLSQSKELLETGALNQHIAPETIKTQLRNAFLLPSFKKGDPANFTGMLLYGPPGTGKTELFNKVTDNYLAKLKLPGPLFKIDLKEVFDTTDINELNTRNKTFLNWLSKQKTGTHIAAFWDEIDGSLNSESSEIRSAVLDFINKFKSLCKKRGIGCHMVYATNNAHKLPDALIRPGRTHHVMHMDYLQGQNNMNAALTWMTKNLAAAKGYNENTADAIIDHIKGHNKWNELFINKDKVPPVNIESLAERVFNVAAAEEINLSSNEGAQAAVNTTFPLFEIDLNNRIQIAEQKAAEENPISSMASSLQAFVNLAHKAEKRAEEDAE